MKIDEDKIRDIYGSVKSFCKDENIGIGVYNGLKRKKTLAFQEGSASFKAYRKMKSMGFIINTPQTEAA